MGQQFDRTADFDARFHFGTYARKPVLFVRGEGCRLYDDEGSEYLDFVGAIGSVNLGHADPEVASAACAQMSKLVAVSNLFHVEHRAELAGDIVELFGGDAKVFFANSGAEANEGAIKLARKWGKQQRGEGCFEVVTALNSFHGRTIATLAATGQPNRRVDFEPVPAGFVHVPLNDIEALEAAVTGATCAIMLEPVQGESGVWPCTPEYLAAAARIADERDVLLILDEVQTGIYRTGHAFAHQAFDVRPHIMTLAKSLANGLPIGAIVATDQVAATFVPGDHGSTFGGGPVVCAAARATLAAHRERDTAAHATAMGEYLHAGLVSLAETTGMIAEVRGAGLMVGCSLARPVAADAATALMGRGIVVNHIGTDILRFLPPLVCGKAEIDTLLTTLEDVLTEVAS